MLELPTFFVSDSGHEIETRSSANKSHKRGSSVFYVRSRALLAITALKPATKNSGQRWKVKEWREVLL